MNQTFQVSKYPGGWGGQGGGQGGQGDQKKIILQNLFSIKNR